MSQFKIKGIDYTDDSLQHASYVRTTGRTNPYGSMKIGSKEYREKYNAGAFQDEHGVWYGKGSRALNQRDGKKRQRQQEAAARQNLNSKIPTIVARDRRPLSQRKPVNLQQRTVTTTTTTTSQPSNPAATTARGKDAVAQLMGVAVDPRGQAQPLEGLPKRKLQDAQGQPIIEKDARQQNTAQNENLLDRAGRAVTDAANAAGQWVGNAANDVGRAVTDAANTAGQWIGNAANDVGNFVGNTAQNVGQAVTDAANSAGQWVGNAANDVGRAVSNVVNPPRQETPQQKSLWDTIGGWFAQAGQDIANTAVGAWDTVSGAASDAAKWVGDRLNEAGDWAQTAMNDVGQWVGDRAAEFDTWLNGRQIVGKQGNTWREGGALNDVGNALNAAGQWIGNAADRVWNGHLSGNDGDLFRIYHPGMRDQLVGNPEMGISGWFTDPIGAANQQIVQPMLNGGTYFTPAPGNRTVSGGGGRPNRPPDADTRQAQNNGGFFDAAGRWISNAANDVGNFVNDNIARPVGEWWNGRDVEVNDNGRWRQGHEAGARENIGNTLNAAGQWIGNAANDVGQLVGNAANDVGQWVGNTAADIWEGPVTYNASPRTGTVTNADGTTSVITYGQGTPIRTGGLRDQLNAAGQWIGNAADDVRDAAVNLPDNVLGRYPVIDTDENGNLVYGNQRQGGLVGRLSRDGRNLMNQASQWANDNFVTPIGNAFAPYAQAADNLLNGTPVTNRYYDTQTGQWVEPGTRVGGVLPWARNAYNTAEGAVVDAADAVRDTAVNAYNSARDAVANTYNNARDAYNNYQDDQNVRSIARQSAAYQNAPEESRQQVEQDFTDRYKTARNNRAYQAAVSAGVPTAELNNLIGNYAQGSMDSYDFVNELNRLSNLYANVYNQ